VAYRGKVHDRSEAIIGPETRLILRHSRDIDWQSDLDWPACRRMLGKVGTFVGLVAGERQFAGLRGLEPDLLVMGCPEARTATRSNTTDPDAVFDRLVALSPAKVVVMTDGASAAHVANRE
jgi:hypothetical protein